MGWRHAAHALHHDLDGGIGQDVIVACGHTGVGKAVGQLEDACDLDVIDVLGDDLVDAAPDGAVPKDGNLHLVPIFLLCVISGGPKASKLE